LGYVLKCLEAVGLLIRYDVDQEWNKYRYTRRLICLDDWKPNPPWTKIDNDFMKRHYDLGIPNQYSYEFAKY
jgi:hypothetical protein